MATILLQVPDESLVSKVKQACKMLIGVASVKVQRETATQAKMHDVTKTAAFREALEDVEHGRVTKYESLTDFYKEMGL